MTFKQRPQVNTGHNVWVPLVVVVHRFDYTSQNKFQFDYNYKFDPIRVNGPVAALVAETDLTLLMFGGGVVVVVFVVILVAIFVCRRHGNNSPGGSQLLKYSLHPTQCRKSNNTNGMASNGTRHSVLKNSDRCSRMS